MNELGARRLFTVSEVREIIGRERLGRPTAYRLARRFGIRLGHRLLVPAWVVEALLAGELEEFRAARG